MRYGSVCSGIEAATVAWHDLGWTPAWFSEIEAFPNAVLAHRFPDVPNLGDMTTLHEREEFRDRPIDLLVGGTPCQSFSVAGLRKGLDDPRGNLALVFLRLAELARPRWIVWENVPGVLSSSGGRDFGAFLGALGYLGYGWSYRVLDAQHFGVPQRRRRVFVVGHLGDWRRAAAVLFEPASLRGDLAKGRGEGVKVAADARCGSAERSWPAEVASTLNAAFGSKLGLEDQHIRGGAPLFVPVPYDRGQNVIAFHATQSPISGPISPALSGNAGIACLMGQGGSVMNVEYDKTGTLRRETHGHESIVQSEESVVRRLTPRECERLQGFPDDWTLIPYKNKMAPDSPRYKACGNSMAVPVMRWIGRRIAFVDALESNQ